MKKSLKRLSAIGKTPVDPENQVQANQDDSDGQDKDKTSSE
jgi:hypothetical protein